METTSPFKAIQDLQDQQREGWMPESDTPETDATRKDVMAGRWSLVEKGGLLEKLEKLERERNEARQQVADLNQRLNERRESFQAQLIRIEDTWREKLRESRKDAQRLYDASECMIIGICACAIPHAGERATASLAVSEAQKAIAAHKALTNNK